MYTNIQRKCLLSDVMQSVLLYAKHLHSSLCETSRFNSKLLATIHEFNYLISDKALKTNACSVFNNRNDQIPAWSRRQFQLITHCYALMSRVVLVENIPKGISISHEATMPLTEGFNVLLDQARRSVEIVSPWWDLNSTEPESRFPSQAKQVHYFILIPGD